MGFVRPDLMPNGTKWSADGGHSGGQAYKTVGFWVGIMCGIGFIHRQCLENWFATSLARLSDDDPAATLTCPLCRQEMPVASRRRRDGEETKDAAGEVELRDV